MNSVGIRILSALLEARTGQHLQPGRLWRIETSLKPIMRELDLASIDALAARIVREADERLTTRVVEAMLNNESFFYRDPNAFQLLAGKGLDRIYHLRRDVRRLRIWSAGCSTGQEPYSLAMMLRDNAVRWAGWTVEIVATDISHKAIARARQGQYSQFEVQRGLPARTMLKYFVQKGNEWTIDPIIRRAVQFRQHNIANEMGGMFDIILCRNVLMYFTETARLNAYNRLANALEPHGLLMLGAGETVLGQTDRFASDPELRGLYASVTTKPAPMVQKFG
jgi:chemotaxis protein methyltransferase CheR